jgi:hypothetical protein
LLYLLLTGSVVPEEKPLLYTFLAVLNYGEYPDPFSLINP